VNFIQLKGKVRMFWRLRAECASKTERWNANIRLMVSTSKLTWSSERGTTTYVRCPMASASR